MKYEELTKAEQSAVDMYLDMDKLNAHLSEAQGLIDSGISAEKMAEYYGTIVNGDCDCEYVDINVPNFAFSVYFDYGRSVTEIGSAIDVWDDDDGAMVFEYMTDRQEFFLFRLD